MSFEKVKNYLKNFSLEEKIALFEEPTSTVEEAAKMHNCLPGQIAKSMSFWIKDKPIIIVASGDSKINNQKFKALFTTKAKMISNEDVENVTGHPVGGVCPFLIPENIDVFLDISLKKFDTVIAACGSKNSTVTLTIEELEKTSNFKSWIDICQDKL